MIARLTAQPGRRDDLIAALSRGTRDMPGCLSYVIAKDAAEEDGVWVTEAWDSEASHDASLTVPAVLETIAQAKPLVAKFERVAVTEPVAGIAGAG